MMEEVWFLKQIFKNVCIEFVAKMAVCIEFVAKMAVEAAAWAEGIFVIAECIDLGAEQFAVKNASRMVCDFHCAYRFVKYVFHSRFAAAGSDSYWILSIVIF